MSLTLSDATTEVRDLLNEAAAVFWSDAQIQKWIKEGVRIFSSKTLMVEDTQLLTPETGKLSYSVLDETWIGTVLEIYSVLYAVPAALRVAGKSRWKGLIKIHPRQVGNLATQVTGAPKYYCLHDRQIYVFPETSATIAGELDTRLYCLFAMETDDITAMTDEYQHLPIIYATAKAKQKDMKFGEAGALLSQFFQEVAFERNDKHAREVDSLDKFKIPARGGGNQSAGG